MKSRKIIILVIGFVLIVGLALVYWPQTAVQSTKEQQATDESGPAETGLSEVVFEDDLLESPESELLEPPLSSRTSGSLDENESRKIRQQLDSREPFPADVAMDQYKSKIWEEIQQNPPELVNHGDPDTDAEFAYRLYMFYGNCSISPRTSNELDMRINQITARTQDATEAYLERVERSAEQTFDFFELCAAIPQDVDARLEAVKWMSEAVYLGHPIAQTQYYEKAMGFLLRPNRFSNDPPIVMLHSGLVDEFKATARYALSRAVENGHPEAFLAMSQAQMDDIIYPRDPVLAMAYVRVAELAAMENRIIESRIQRQRDRVTPQLTPEQIAEADELAHRIRLGESI